MALPIIPTEPDQDCYDSNGVLWRRSGSCNRCGDCCLGCEALTWDGEVAVCSARDDVANAYHAYYWKNCVLFPQLGPYPGLPRCSYVFTEVTSG